jgi:hypothetical protein
MRVFLLTIWLLAVKDREGRFHFLLELGKTEKYPNELNMNSENINVAA